MSSSKTTPRWWRSPLSRTMALPGFTSPSRPLSETATSALPGLIEDNARVVQIPAVRNQAPSPGRHRHGHGDRGEPGRGRRDGGRESVPMLYAVPAVRGAGDLMADEPVENRILDLAKR